MQIMSCDPGKSGAIIEFISGIPQRVYDMPVMKAGSKNIVDYNEVAKLFNSFKPGVVVVEQVGASPRAGVASMFGFGMSFGILLAAGAGCGAQVVTITPNKWKAATGLLKKPKEASLGRAIELYPEQADWFKRKMDIDRADCILIGHTYIMFNGG